MIKKILKKIYETKFKPTYDLLNLKDVTYELNYGGIKVIHIEGNTIEIRTTRLDVKFWLKKNQTFFTHQLEVIESNYEKLNSYKMTLQNETNSIGLIIEKFLQDNNKYFGYISY
jgi:hypothetical protein